MLNPDCSPIYTEAVSKRNTSAASSKLRHLDCSTTAVVSSYAQRKCSLKHFAVVAA